MQFSRPEMVCNEASHVWLSRPAFSCLAACQDVRASFPPAKKIIFVTLLRIVKSNLFFWRL